jgi:hypothetical protein
MVRQKRQDLNSLVELSGPPESWGELIAVILGKIPSSGLRFASGERSTRALESRTPATINHWTEPLTMVISRLFGTERHPATSMPL